MDPADFDSSEEQLINRMRGYFKKDDDGKTRYRLLGGLRDREAFGFDMNADEPWNEEILGPFPGGQRNVRGDLTLGAGDWELSKSVRKRWAEDNQPNASKTGDSKLVPKPKPMPPPRDDSSLYAFA